MKTTIKSRVRWFFLLWFVAAFLEGLTVSLPAHAQFGGSTIVFDPSVYARQLAQLQQETAAVQNLASQLQYMIKNTTGGGAGVWQSNQNLLANLGGLISEQEGLSYTFQGLSQQFQQLYPGYQVTSTPGAQSPQAMTTTTLNTLNGALASAQALAQVQQIQMLRQLVMAQMNSQNVAAANQVNAQVQSNLAAQAVFSQQYPGDSFNPTNNAPAPSQH